MTKVEASMMLGILIMGIQYCRVWLFSALLFDICRVKVKLS